MGLQVSTDRDPFANTTDAAAYVPRTATEYALVSVEMALLDGARAIRLVGPSGSGKSLLLRVIEERLAGDFAWLRVPYSKLDPDEFCSWGLDALGERPVENPERALAARIRRRAESGDPPLVWVVDDADLLPVATLGTLLAIQRSTGDALRLLFASSSDLPADEFAQAGVRSVHVELEGEMGRDEMATYVHERLARADVDSAERERIEGALDQLYARSHGNPARLHAAASALLCFGPERLEARDEREPDAPTAIAAETSATEPESSTPPAAERVSIESLVAEAVASEPEEVVLAEPIAPPTTELVTPPPATELVADASESEPPGSEPPRDDPTPPAPRRRHRLRRFGRR